jgi:hypothetical protein
MGPVKSPDNRSRSNTGRTIVAYVGAAFFIAASAVVTWYARRAQVTGEPMPNGRGGFVPFSDGYKIAAMLFVLSLAYGWRARALSRRRAG